MQFMLDHLAAIVVSAVVIMVIAVVQLRGTDTSIEATQYAAAKTRMLDIVQYVERDFMNIGSGMPDVSTAIAELDDTGSTREFRFQARTSQADPAPYPIVYRWTETGEVDLSDENNVATWTIERIVDGDVSGTSMDTITDFRIELMQEDSTAIVTNYQDTRIIAVHITAVSPLGVSKGLEQTRWSKVFRPVNLTRQ